MNGISRLASLLAACILFSIILFFTTSRTIRVYHVPVAKETIQFGLCDFHNAVYFPGLAYARGENPYSSTYAAKYPVNREMSPYSPLLLPFSAVMGVLPLRLAEFVWYATNVTLILVLSAALLHIAGSRINATRVLLLSSLILATRVGQSNQILGQFGLYFTLLTLVAVRWARSNQNLSAIGVALASIKPTFGIPLVLMMLSGQKLRPAILGLLIATVGATLSFSWILLHEPFEVLASFVQSHDAIASDQDVDPDSAWMRTDLTSVLARNLGLPSGLKMELLGMTIILIPACILLWKLSKIGNSCVTHSLEQAIVLSAIPMCIYHLSYDLLVVMPAVALGLSGQTFPKHKHSTAFQIAFVAFMTIPLVNYLSAYSVMERLQIDGLVREMVISLNALSLLAANAVLWVAAFIHIRSAEDLDAEEGATTFSIREQSTSDSPEESGMTVGT